MIEAILFDMDGTVTEPNIDWRALRDQLGVPQGTAIMDHISSLPADERESAEVRLRQAEFAAARKATPTPGVIELTIRLRARGIRLGLVTNNHREAMEHVVEKIGLCFDLMLSREDGTLKPAPDLLLMALRELGLSPAQVRFVGDGHYDCAASAAAGVEYIHLSHESNQPVDGPTIHSLDELWDYLEL